MSKHHIQKKSFKGIKLSLLSSAIALAVSGQVVAQEQTEEESYIESITVTATKRSSYCYTGFYW